MADLTRTHRGFAMTHKLARRSEDEATLVVGSQDPWHEHIKNLDLYV